MDLQNGQIQLPQAPQEKKRSIWKGFFFLEIGLFEVLFVSIMLAFIFGILNYFHIINLSQFSTIIPTIFTSKNPPLSDKQLQDNLTSFISSTLKSTYQPSSYTFQKTVTGNVLTIATNWQQQNSTFNANVIYNQSTNKQTAINLQTTISSSAALPSSFYAENLFAIYITNFTSKAKGIGCKFDKQQNEFICYSPTPGSINSNTSYQVSLPLKSTKITLQFCQKTGLAITIAGCPNLL